jgi:hypothetical protein
VRVSLFPSNYYRAGIFHFVYTDWIFLGSICVTSFGVVVRIVSYECFITGDYQNICVFSAYQEMKV